MVTAVDAVTALVLTVKVALVAPAATVTLEGTLAAVVLLLESATWAPPAGAAPVNVTVPVEDCVPPITLVGLSVSEERVTTGGGAGATVIEAVLVTPPYAPALVTPSDATPILLLPSKLTPVPP